MNDCNAMLQDLVGDKRLDEVAELLKKSDDIFGIIRPTEMQHSTILAWLFNPREGHGQGDAIFKDFLHAAAVSTDEHVHANKKFFDHWTPSRIARTGFHGLCLLPEYKLENGQRLDLLIVDFDKELLVVVENKHGARYSIDQLQNYYTEVGNTLRKRPVFEGFRTAHVALDRNYRRTDSGSAQPAPLNRWAYIDYLWLERGASRAQLHMGRGNQSAALVTAYCRNQSDYESPEARHASDLIAELALEYRPLVDALADVTDVNLAALTPGMRDNELWRFAQHHPDIVERLVRTKALAFLRPSLRRTLPHIPIETEFRKHSVRIFPTSWKVLAEQEDAWPLVLWVWIADTTADGTSTFGMALYYSAHDCKAEYAHALEDALAGPFPELRKGRQGASYKTLGNVKSVSQASLETKVRQLLEAADNAVRSTLA